MFVAPGRRSLLVALGQLGLFAAALTAVVIALLPTDGNAPLWSLVVYALVGPAYGAAGLVAWWRRPSGRVGPQLCLCGSAFLASAMGVADREHRRIAPDLPDGLQAQLVVLALRVGRLPEASELRTGVEAAIAQLRDLVHGITPALLVERGVYAATRQAEVQHASRIYNLLGLAGAAEDHRRVLAVVRYLNR